MSKYRVRLNDTQVKDEDIDWKYIFRKDNCILEYQYDYKYAIISGWVDVDKSFENMNDTLDYIKKALKRRTKNLFDKEHLHLSNDLNYNSVIVITTLDKKYQLHFTASIFDYNEKENTFERDNYTSDSYILINPNKQRKPNERIKGYFGIKKTSIPDYVISEGKIFSDKCEEINKEISLWIDKNYFIENSKFQDAKDNIHNKIAHWILEQEIARGIKSADIREIGKLIFGLELTARDIKKVKEALEGLGYDRILDAKPVTWDEIENAIYDEYDGPEHSEVDYSDCLRGFETSKDAKRLMSFLKNKFDLKMELREDSYGGYKIKVYGVKDSIKDSKFKDERLEPTAENAWRHLGQYRYKYGSYMDAFLEMVFRFKLTNYEINALIDRAFDREYIDEYEVEKCKNYVKDVFDNNGNIKRELLKAFLGDAKLTRRQKLWYAEELEKFIHPQYLRKNYQLRRLKRRVK